MVHVCVPGLDDDIILNLKADAISRHLIIFIQRRLTVDLECIGNSVANGICKQEDQSFTI